MAEKRAGDTISGPETPFLFFPSSFSFPPLLRVFGFGSMIAIDSVCLHLEFNWRTSLNSPPKIALFFFFSLFSQIDAILVISDLKLSLKIEGQDQKLGAIHGDTNPSLLFFFFFSPPFSCSGISGRASAWPMVSPCRWRQ